MTLVTGQRVLRRIFTLRRCLTSGSPCVLWEAEPGDGEGVLIKAWPFVQDGPTPVERNLWDRELRTLYRLASTPEAERRLVTLIDAAVDLDAKAFVLALKVPGFDRLSDVLRNRSRSGWLSDLSDVSRRIALWRGALRLIEGLAHVHRFRSVHRAVRPENIFLDVRLGPDSFRLGGFEWSVRLGAHARNKFDATSPLGRANASLNADWRDLGFVLAGIFGVQADAVESGDIARIISEIQELRRVTEDEKSYLRTLVTADGNGPIDRDDMIRACSDLIDSLERPARLRSGDHVGVVVSLSNRLGPTDLAIRIAETDPQINATDELAIRRWIEADLSDAEIVTAGDIQNRSYFLKGRRLPYRLVPFERRLPGGDSETTWNLGYLIKAEFVDERRVVRRFLPFPAMIAVHTVQVAHTSYSEICRKVRSWEGVLPPPPEITGESQPEINFLRRFLEVTNEIERAIRETEIYPIRFIRGWTNGSHEYAVVEETARNPALPMSDRTSSMIQYLSDEEAKAPIAQLEIFIGPEGELDFPRRVEPAEFWVLHELPPGTAYALSAKQVLLRRFSSRPGTKALPTPEEATFLRTRGMFAQITLVDRRAEAINLLSAHLFLQRALVMPDTVYMDTGIDELPLPIPEQASLDQAKRTVLKQIWRTRPLFCLQGPPGTGKTTLVAQLLKQIYEDDPSCQVLLTAQAHSAVDHLRDEVSKFVRARKREDPLWTAPLAVRLRKPRPNEIESDLQDSASPSALAREILASSIRDLQTRVCPPQHIRDWLDYARGQSDDGDFEQLVRRGANFVYCTSTAADLLELAQSNQTFDWSIIEEAGKAHGFDLVLPLQTGHRWLLIGDQNQLPPYREKDFALGLDRLEVICKSDADLRRFWGDMPATERQAFTDTAKRWLFFFRELFETVQRRIQSEIPLVGMLTEQHRMHPEIGNLISHAFYGNRITNATVDSLTGRPLERVLHHFAIPQSMREIAIVWVNVPRSPLSSTDPDEGKLLNAGEVKAVERILQAMQPSSEFQETSAVLTPYKRQVRELRSNLRQKPVWALLPEGFEHLAQDRIGVFTVDSFQGRQASVVVVSLVRNNTEREITAAFGFLTEHERINVMMSRAEKLLVLVGAWEFFRAHLASKSREPGQPFAELARLADWLEQSFKNGKALLTSAEEFTKGGAL
jgi:AAA domain